MVAIHGHFNHNYKLFRLTHKVWLWLWSKSGFDLNLLAWTISGLETNHWWIVVLIIFCSTGFTQTLSPVLLTLDIYINASLHARYYPPPLLRLGSTVGYSILIAWVGVGRYVGFELCNVVRGEGCHFRVEWANWRKCHDLKLLKVWVWKLRSPSKVNGLMLCISPSSIEIIRGLVVTFATMRLSHCV